LCDFGRFIVLCVSDSPSFVTPHPIPTEEDIEFILKELRRCLSGDVLVCNRMSRQFRRHFKQVRREDVLSAWCGLRPLVKYVPLTRQYCLSLWQGCN
jgi:glycerol-3-phosphate dehydrogenase